MKLRNKKTGKIHEITQAVFLSDDMNKKFAIYSQSEGHNYAYRTLAELNEEWEDYEEPKEYWFISDRGEIFHTEDNMSIDEKRKSFGNYFETKEEAEKALEKLKAVKRLKNYNVKFNLDFVRNRIDFIYSINNTLLGVLDGEEQIFNNMKIIFGDEE